MRPKTLPQWKIPYEVSSEPMPGHVTGLGGMAVASRTFRGMKLPGSCEANLSQLRRIAAGYPAGQIVETVVVACMMGADCLEDIDRLREDPAAEKMLGYKPPSARTIRDWLEKFHDDEAIRSARWHESSLDAGARTAIIPKRLWSCAQKRGQERRRAGRSPWPRSRGGAESASSRFRALCAATPRAWLQPPWSGC